MQLKGLILSILYPLFKRLKVCQFSVLIFFVSTSLLAKPFANNLHDRELEQYFKLSGINELLDSIPEQLKFMQIDAEAEYGIESSDNQISLALLEAWDDKKIKFALKAKIAEAVTSQQLSALIKWQSSVLAQHIKQKDLAAEHDNFEQEFVQFVANIPANMPDKNHRVAINKVIDAKRMVDNMIDLTISVSRPVLLALVNSESAESENMSVADVERQLVELEQLLQNDLSHQISMLSYFLYKDLSITELNQYAHFYQSELGLLELSLLNQALHYSIALWQSAYVGNSPHILLTKRAKKKK